MTKYRICEKPDRDVQGLKCGYPLPCPHHTIVLDVSQEAVTLRLPRAAEYPSRKAKKRLLAIGKAVKR